MSKPESENALSYNDTKPETELLPLAGSVKMEILGGTLKIEETVLIVCEGHCIAISRSVLTTASTLFDAKLSERWNSPERHQFRYENINNFGDCRNHKTLLSFEAIWNDMLNRDVSQSDGQETFIIETILNFSWKSVQILIETIKANVNGYSGTLYDEWLEDDACLIAEIISLADYLGCTQIIPDFWQLLEKIEEKMCLDNVLHIFHSLKILEDIMETKTQCQALEKKCINYLKTSFPNGPLKDFILDNKSKMDLVIEILEKTKLK